MRYTYYDVTNNDLSSLVKFAERENITKLPPPPIILLTPHPRSRHITGVYVRRDIVAPIFYNNWNVSENEGKLIAYSEMTPDQRNIIDLDRGLQPKYISKQPKYISKSPIDDAFEPSYKSSLSYEERKKKTSTKPKRKIVKKVKKCGCK